MPFDCSIGLHTSQRTVGQEFAVDFVDDAVLPENPSLVVSSISQTTTTLTITTVQPHNLVAGKRFQVSGCSDNRLNYPALVVASTPSPTQFTATAGPAGTIPSVTASATTGIGMTVVGGAADADNTSVTAATLVGDLVWV